MTSSPLVGVVTAKDGIYYVVTCDVPKDKLYLRTHHLLPHQMGKATLGDRVKMEYYADLNRGYWHVTEVLP